MQRQDFIKIASLIIFGLFAIQILIPAIINSMQTNQIQRTQIYLLNVTYNGPVEMLSSGEQIIIKNPDEELFSLVDSLRENYSIILITNDTQETNILFRDSESSLSFVNQLPSKYQVLLPVVYSIPAGSALTDVNGNSIKLNQSFAFRTYIERSMLDSNASFGVRALLAYPTNTITDIYSITPLSEETYQEINVTVIRPITATFTSDNSLLEFLKEYNYTHKVDGSSVMIAISEEKEDLLFEYINNNSQLLLNSSNAFLIRATYQEIEKDIVVQNLSYFPHRNTTLLINATLTKIGRKIISIDV